jgi:steroid delta-isomerase-like uncharacterized protein
MPAYSITEVEVLDEAAAARYAEIAGASVARYGGRFLVLAASPEVVEGDADPRERIVLLQFPSTADLRTWYDSTEYAPGRELAAAALRRRLRFVEGVEGVQGAAQPGAEAEAVVRRFYEAMSTGALHLADEVLTPDWEDIPLLPGVGTGPQGYKDTIGFLRSVFPDLTMTVEDVVVDGDAERGKVAVRSTARGTHRGEILGVPATGRTVEFSAFDVHHLRAGRIERSWHLEDYTALLQQLATEPTGT